MNRRETEEKLRKACCHAAPDVLKGVKERLENASEEDCIVPMNLRQKKRTRYSVFVPAVLSGAAAILLVCNVLLLLAGKNNENKAVRTVALELNPGVELGVNSDGRVVNVKTLDKKSAEMIAQMDLNGTDADVAVNAIVGAMYQSGSLCEDQIAVTTVEVSGPEEITAPPATEPDQTGADGNAAPAATAASDDNNSGNNEDKQDAVSGNMTEETSVSDNVADKIDMSALKKHNEAGADAAYHIALKDAGVSEDQVTEHRSSWQLEEDDPEVRKDTATVTPTPTPSAKTEAKASGETDDKVEASVSPSAKASVEATASPSARASVEATASPSAKASVEATASPSAKASVEATASPSVKASAEAASPSAKASEAAATPSVKASAKATDGTAPAVSTKDTERMTGGFYLVTFKTARYTYIYMIDEDGEILSVSRSAI